MNITIVFLGSVLPYKSAQICSLGTFQKSQVLGIHPTNDGHFRQINGHLRPLTLLIEWLKIDLET